MKRLMHGVVWSASVALMMTSAAWAKTVMWTVAAGETKTFTQMEAGGEKVVEGDTIIKQGPGVLKVDSDHAIKCTIIVEEGVFNVAALKMGNNGTVTVRKGACLYFSGGTEKMLNGWAYHVEGEGTGMAPYLGAIVVNGNNNNGQLVNGTFNLTGDATFYTCENVVNNMFSGTSSASGGGPTFNMNNHTVTLKGAGTPASKFRSRWAWKIRSTGPFVIDGLAYLRHANSATTMDDYDPIIPEMKLVNGAVASLDGYYFTKVNQFDCAAGTSFGYSSAQPLALGAAGAYNATLKKVIGCPSVLSDTVLTIDQEFVVRGSDLAAGHKLSSVNALTFSSGCTLDVTELDELTFSKEGTVYTIAESQEAIVGTPILTGDAGSLFTIANTGTSVTITTKPNDGGAFLPGREYGAVNTAALATFCAEATDGMNVLLTKGDYYFTEDFDLSTLTARNVTISSTDHAATIHATLKLGAAQNVTISKINFAETSGPAVVANGTVGLTIADCTLTDVEGAWTDGRKYPFAALNVTDFELRNPTFVFTGDKHPWDGSAYFAGGSQTLDSWVRAGEWVVFVDPNDTKTGGDVGTAGINYVTNNNGLAASAYNGLKLRKIGGGTFDPNKGIDVLGIDGVIVAEGRYVERSDTHLGVAKKEVSVASGACLTVAGGSKTINGRTVNIEGTGLKADQPAVCFTGNSVWDKLASVTWNLTGDATMYDDVGNDANGNFLWVTFRMNDHALTLTGKAGGVYRIGRSCAWSGGGQMIVSGVKLMATPSGSGMTKPNTGAFTYTDGKRPKFVFRNDGAKAAIFAPESYEIQYLVSDVDFATSDCLFAPGKNDDVKNLPHPLAFSFHRFAGAPSFGENLESLTIENNYTIHADQLKAGEVLRLEKPLIFGNQAMVTIDDLAAYQKPVKMLIATAPAITGCPKADAAAKEAGWRVVKSANADGTDSLYLDSRRGLLIIFH